MSQSGQGLREKMNSSADVAGWDEELIEIVGVQRGRNRKQKFELVAQKTGGLQNSRHVHANFFPATARHQRDPLLGRVEVEVLRILLTRDFGPRESCERMPHKFGIDSAIAIELFFERENDEGFVHVVTEKLHAPLPPCPELRANVIDDGDASLLHFA